MVAPTMNPERLSTSSSSAAVPSQRMHQAMSGTRRAVRRFEASSRWGGQTTIATSAYIRAAPGAPLSALAPGLKSPPAASPKSQTMKAHATEAPRAARVVRRQQIPNPTASCMAAQATLHPQACEVTNGSIRLSRSHSHPGGSAVPMRSIIPR